MDDPGMKIQPETWYLFTSRMAKAHEPNGQASRAAWPSLEDQPGAKPAGILQAWELLSENPASCQALNRAHAEDVAEADGAEHGTVAQTAEEG